MIRKAAIVLAAVGLVTSACTPISSFQGFQAIDQSPADVKVGQDTKSTVLSRLGTPTATSTFDADTWFYISQVSNKTAFYHPRVSKREVVAIHFAKGADQVASVNTYTLQDGRVIAYNNRETPTRGREMSALEQIIGTIGAQGVLPPDQNQTPGSHGGQPN